MSRKHKKRRGYARRRGNNKWQLEVDLGKKLYGKGRNRKFKTITAKSEAEANEKLALFIAEVTDAKYVDVSDMMFVDFVRDIWYPKTKGKRLADTTLETHLEVLESRILPAFQQFKLKEIQPLHIMDFLDNLEEPGMRLDKRKDPEKQKENEKKVLKSSTIFYHYRVLNNIFNFGVEIKALKESPLDGVRKPRVEYKEVEPYTIDESIQIYQALSKELLHWEVAVKLMIMCGLRRSELYGLDLLKHISLKNKVLHVRQALTYTRNYGYSIHEIKKGSRRAKKRDIALPDDLIHPIALLIEQKRKEREALSEDGLWGGGEHTLVLSHENGEPYNPSSMKNWWDRFLKRHGFRHLNIHGLRHTMVTLLIELGIPISQISKRAGHSGIGVTSDTYGHRVQTIDELSTARLSEVLNSRIESQYEPIKTIEKQAPAVKLPSKVQNTEKDAISE